MTREEFVYSKVFSPHERPEHKANVTSSIRQALGEWDNLPENRRVAGFGVEDILATASVNLKIELTDEEALEVLEMMEHGYDASIGMDWDVIEVYIRQWCDQKGDQQGED